MTVDRGEDHLRDLFAEVPVPPGVDAWRALGVRRSRRRPVALAAAALTLVLVVAGVWYLTTAREVRTVPAQTGPSAPTSWPTAATTGVPAGTHLTNHEGDLRITTQGAVVQDLAVHGTVVVDAADVTLRRVRIVPGPGQDPAISETANASNLQVEDCEISSGGVPYPYGIGQLGRGLHVTRCHFSGMAIGLTVTQDAVVADNLVDGLPDTIYTAGIITHGFAQGPIVIRHNTVALSGGHGLAIALLPTYGPIRDVTVQDNLVLGGEWALSAGGGGAGTQGVRVLGNHFSAGLYPTCGLKGPATAFAAGAPGAQWRDNVWHETGAAVPSPN